MQKILVKCKRQNDQVLRKLYTMHDQKRCRMKLTKMGRLKLSWLIINNTWFVTQKVHWNQQVLRKLCKIHDLKCYRTKFTVMGRLKLSWPMINNSRFLMQKILDKWKRQNATVLLKLYTMHGRRRCRRKLTKMGRLKLSWLMINNT